jgi:glycine betaine catabolism B
MKFETKATEIIQRTHNVKSFRFTRPASFDYLAGQFFFITIKKNQEEQKKHFSFSTSPTEKEFFEFTKKITDSQFSKTLTSLQINDQVTIDGPYGKFTLEEKTKNAGMLAGGIGITPLRSICRFCTDKQTDTKITLLYSNITEKDIAFKEDLEQMQRQNNNIKIEHVLESPPPNWNSHVGRINENIIKQEIPNYIQTTFFICGPPAMNKAMENLLNNIGVTKENIKLENFTGY